MNRSSVLQRGFADSIHRVAVLLWLAGILGGLATGPAAHAQGTGDGNTRPAAAITPDQIRRQFVPIGQPNVWPRGEFLPWPADEFQLWMRSGRVTPGANGAGPATRLPLARQVYRARLEGTQWQQGQFVWTLNEAPMQGVTLPAGLIAIANPRQGAEAIPWGTDPGGMLRLFPQPGVLTVKGDWEPGRLDPFGTAGWSLWRYPPALVTRFELTLPHRLRLTARGCEVTVSPAPDGADRVWSIEAGPAREVAVVVSPDEEPVAGPTFLRYTAETAFSLRTESARLQSDLFVTSPVDLIRDVVLRIPSDVRLEAITVRDLPVAMRPVVPTADPVPSSGKASTDHLVTIPLELQAGIPAGPIRIRGQAPAAVEGTIRVAVPSIESADFVEGGVVVRAEPPFQMGDIETSGLRVSSITQRPGEGDQLNARQTRRDASLSVSAYTSDLLAEIDTWTLMRFEPQVTTAETVAVWRAQAGSTFDLKCRLPAGWEITDVRTDGDQQPGDVSRWRYDDATGTLRIDLLSPLTPQTPRRLRISARHPGDSATAPVTAPRLISPGATGGTNWCAVVDSQFRSPQFAEVVDDSGRRKLLETASVPSGWSELSIGREPLRGGEQIVGAARLPADNSLTEVRLSSPRRPVEVEARLTCRAVAGECIEELQLQLTPREQVVDRITVAGFAADSEWSWSIVSPRGLDLRVEPRPALTEEQGSRYEVRLSEAVSSPVLLTAVRTNSAGTPGNLSLPYVEEIRTFRGRLILATDQENVVWRPEPASGGELPRSATVETGGTRAWDYPAGTATGRWVKAAVTGSPGAANLALDVRGRARLASAPEGGTAVELELRGLPEGTYEFPVRFPPGVDHVAVEGPALLEPVAAARTAVNGSSAVVDTASTSPTASEYRLRSSPARHEGTVVVRYNLPEHTLPSLGRVTILLPEFQVAISRLAVETILPPGWAFSHSSRKPRPLSDDTTPGWKLAVDARLDAVETWTRTLPPVSNGSQASGSTELSPTRPVPELTTSAVWVGSTLGAPLVVTVYERLSAFYLSLLAALFTALTGVVARSNLSPRRSVGLAAGVLAVAILVAGAAAPWAQLARWVVIGLAIALLVPSGWLSIPRPRMVEPTSSPQGSTRSFAAVARGAVLLLALFLPLTTSLMADEANGDMVWDVLVPVDEAGQPAARVNPKTALVYIPPALAPVLDEFRRTELDVPPVLLRSTELRPGKIVNGRLACTLTVDVCVRRGSGLTSLRIPAARMELDRDRGGFVDSNRANVLPLNERNEFVIELPPTAPVPTEDSEADRQFVPRRLLLAVWIDPTEDGQFVCLLPRAALHRIELGEDWLATRDVAGFDGTARTELPLPPRSASAGENRFALADVIAWRLRLGRSTTDSSPVTIGMAAETSVSVRQELTDVTIRATLDLPARYLPTPIGWRLPPGWRLIDARAGGRLLAERRGQDRDSETWWIVPAGTAPVTPLSSETTPPVTADQATEKSTPLTVELVCQTPTTLASQVTGARPNPAPLGTSLRPTTSDSTGGLVLDRLEWLPEGVSARPNASPRLVIRAVAGVESTVTGAGLETAVPLPSDASPLAPDLRPVVAWRLPAAARLSVQSTLVQTPITGSSRSDILLGATRGRIRLVAELDEMTGVSWRIGLSPGLRVTSATVQDGPVERLLRWSQQGEQLRLVLSEKAIRKPLVTITGEFETGAVGVPLSLPRWFWPGDRVVPSTVTLYHRPEVTLRTMEGLVPVDAPAPRTFTDAVVFGTYVDTDGVVIELGESALDTAPPARPGDAPFNGRREAASPPSAAGTPPEQDHSPAERNRPSATSTPDRSGATSQSLGEPYKPLQVLLQPVGARLAFAALAVAVCLVLPHSQTVRIVVQWIQQRTWRGASLLALGLWGLGWAAEWSLAVAILLGLYGLVADIAARFRGRTVMLSR